MSASSSSWLRKYLRGIVLGIPAAALVTLVVHLSHDLFASADSFLAALVQNVARVLVVSNLSSRDSVPLQIVKITAETHTNEFGDRSPLDRCVLKDALENLMKSRPTAMTLAIDLDLSPPPVLATMEGDEQKRQLNCQTKLEDWLATTANRLGHGNVMAIVLDMDQDRVLQKRDWVLSMAKRGVQIGQGRLVSSHGMVRQFRPCIEFVDPKGERLKLVSLGQLLGDRIDVKNVNQDFKDDQKQMVEALKQSCPKRDNAFWDEDVRPIAFYELLVTQERGQEVSLCQYTRSGCKAAGAPEAPPPAHIIVGSGYSSDDQHLTPLGKLDGVDILAAIATKPDARENKWLSMVIEFGFGLLLFGPWFHGLWHRYLTKWLRRLRLSDDISHDRGLLAELLETVVNFARAREIWLSAALGALIMTLVSLLLSLSYGIWLNVSGIIFGMLIEAAAVSGVVVARSMLKEAERARLDTLV